MTLHRNSTQRFSARAERYVRGRPDYPGELVKWLRTRFDLGPGDALVELGAGTGIFTRQLCEAGFHVDAVEPNDDMRSFAEHELAAFEGCRVSAGSAEQTGLSDGCARGIVAAQAFHWFEPGAVRQESLRLLRPGGFAALIWNDRQLGGTDFAEAYEAFVRHWGRDYAKVSESYAQPASLTQYFSHIPAKESFPHEQRLDREGLLARLISCSYMPGEGDSDFLDMQAAAVEMFDAHAEQGDVRLAYECTVYADVLR